MTRVCPALDELESVIQRACTIRAFSKEWHDVITVATDENAHQMPEIKPYYDRAVISYGERVAKIIILVNLFIFKQKTEIRYAVRHGEDATNARHALFILKRFLTPFISFDVLHNLADDLMFQNIQATNQSFAVSA